MKMTMFNKELLKETLSFQAESYDLDAQDRIVQYVLDYCPDVKVTRHKSGVYITKGEAKLYPAVIAHLDQVHDYTPDFKVHEHGDIFFAFAEGRQVGVGGDDKCGVYLCLQALLDYDAVKVVLFYDEEVGCLGSKQCVRSFFDDVYFIVQGDRRGDTLDFITYTNGLNTCSKAVENAVSGTISKYGYSFARGVYTDVGEVVDRVGVCGVNISAGYYNAHTDDEVVVISEVELAYELMTDVFKVLANQRWTISTKERARYQWGRDFVNMPVSSYTKSNGCSNCGSREVTDYDTWWFCERCLHYENKDVESDYFFS